MCHVDQRVCAEAIIKDGYVYIVDDSKNFEKFTYQEFEDEYEKNKDAKPEEFLILENEKEGYVRMKLSELENIYQKYMELK